MSLNHTIRKRRDFDYSDAYDGNNDDNDGNDDDDDDNDDWSSLH